MKLTLLWSKGYILKNEYCLRNTNHISTNNDIINQIKWCEEHTPGIIWVRTTDSKNKDLKTDLDFFAENLNFITKPCSLITSDGDRDTPSTYNFDTVNYILSCSKIKSWYTQNYDLSIVNEKIKFYPIGINLHHKQEQTNLSYESLNNSLLGINKNMVSQKKKNIIFCDSHLNFTHPERKEMLKILKDNKHIYFLNKKVDFQQIHDMYSKYQFVLSPRGNGVDCYRTWEAILFGAIVITKTSSLDKMYIDNNLPVVILQDWDELNDINLVEKLEKWKNIHLKKTSCENILPKYNINYWIN